MSERAKRLFRISIGFAIGCSIWGMGFINAQTLPAGDQETRPEKIEVPVIAPEYQSDDRQFPEVGLVGVDLMSQKPLSLYW